MANYVLEILDGDRAGEVLPVTERTLRIGRKPANDLVLADEKTSGVHAEVVLEGDRHVLRDLGSTNGTFLDGKRVTEIVLTLGDVVTIGRLRVKFRAEGEGAVADAGELTVRRLDAARLQRRSGSVGLLVGLVVVGLGAAGWFWWQGREVAAEDGGPHKRRQPLVVEHNRLAEKIADCESEDGWILRAAGSGFQASTQANTGSGAFEAVRGEGADAADFAMLASKDPIAVFGGRTMTIQAHAQAGQGASIAVRAHCFSDKEQIPFHFRTGTAFSAPESWQRIEAVVAIPSGCDKLQIEVVAALPASGAWARVDDVAVTEAGQAAVLEHKLAESGQAAIGNDTNLAVRSVNTENLATLLQILPDHVPTALQGLQRAGLCTLSDLGASVVCKPTERSFQVEAKGPNGSDLERLLLVVPAAAAAALLVAAGDDGFQSAAAETEFTCRRLVLGDQVTRAMVQFEQAVACRGSLGGGLYSLSMQTSRFELVLGFNAERLQAQEFLRKARASQQAGKPGEALDHLRELFRTVPFDSEQLGHAHTLRAALLAGQAESLRGFQQDLDEASFFMTRGTFDRVARGVDQVIQLFGEHNLEDAEAAKALRDRARESLQQIDAADQAKQRERLADVAKAFHASKQQGLADVIQKYIERYLPAPGNGSGAGSSGPEPKGK
ncbi:MAG TPA: FHA domain-containing protein [Planctomycetota bacterium]|nr:FHA domain-containing protein [Planctomycetota bacterium]